MNEPLSLLLSRHGVITAGGTQALGKLVVVLPVLTLKTPPVIDSPLSMMTLPSRNVRVVPLPMLRPLGQSIHQLPETETVPDGLQLWPVDHRWNVDGLGLPDAPTAVRKLSRYLGVVSGHDVIARPW